MARPVAPGVKTPDATPRRVRHKAFGEGIVLRESGTGEGRKIEVEFPDAGRKVLLERFLEYLP